MVQIEKRFSVALDIKRSVSNRAFEVVEGDNGNIIDVTLTDDGEAVDLTGCRVLAVFSKSDGVSTQDSGQEQGGIAIDFNRVSIELSISSFAPGMVECELRVYSGERLTTLVTSAKFNFNCRKGIFNDSTAASANEYPLLMSLIAECNRLADDYEGRSAHAPSHAANGFDPVKVGDIPGKAVFTGTGGTLQADILPVAAGGTGGGSAAEARASLGVSAAADVTALQKAEQVFTTAGAAPAFTVADTSVTAYAAGLRRTVQFHAAGTNATLNFNAKGAKALYEYTGKQMSVKAGQVVEVYYSGTYFFGVSVSGVSFPDTPEAGDFCIYETPFTSLYIEVIAPIGNTYVDFGSGTGFTVKRTGAYRARYNIVSQDNKIVHRLAKNDVLVTGSNLTGVTSHNFKMVDFTATAGDVIKMQVAYNTTSGIGLKAYLYRFSIAILGSNVETARNEIMEPF
ncbi:MAG: phage baseplate upper protein [Eubacteriales bacterium]|nr:phage baseplate upper protein [Eubacteriales bacterium]